MDCPAASVKVRSGRKTVVVQGVMDAVFCQLIGKTGHGEDLLLRYFCELVSAPKPFWDLSKPPIYRRMFTSPIPKPLHNTVLFGYMQPQDIVFYHFTVMPAALIFGTAFSAILRPEVCVPRISGGSAPINYCTKSEHSSVKKQKAVFFCFHYIVRERSERHRLPPADQAGCRDFFLP